MFGVLVAFSFLYEEDVGQLTMAAVATLAAGASYLVHEYGLSRLLEGLMNPDQPPVCVRIVLLGALPKRTQPSGETKQADDRRFVRAAASALKQTLRMPRLDR